MRVLLERATDKRKAILAILTGLIVTLSYAASSSLFISTSSGSQLLVSNTQAIIVPFSIGDYGKWEIANETPSSVISTISAIRNATGKQLVLFRIVSGPQVAGQMIRQRGINMSVNDFLLSAQSAAGGGLVIPQIALNFYTSGTNVTTRTFCDPDNSSNCGPSWFFEVSSELLALHAVQDMTPRTIYLDGWDQFNRDLQTLGYPSNQSCTVVQQVLAQGWQKILIKNLSGQFSDCGYASGQVTTVNYQSTSPYLLPDTPVLNLMPTNEQHFVFFDDQEQTGYLGLSYMLAVLNSSQQVTGLTNLFDLQAQDGYTFAVPIFDSIALNGTTYYWDVNVNTQPNGQPFLNLVESLIGTISTSSSSSSTSLSSSNNTTTMTTMTSNTTTSSTSTSENSSPTISTTPSTSTTFTSSTSSSITTNSSSTSASSYSSSQSSPILTNTTTFVTTTVSGTITASNSDKKNDTTNPTSSLSSSISRSSTIGSNSSISTSLNAGLLSPDQKTKSALIEGSSTSLTIFGLGVFGIILYRRKVEKVTVSTGWRW